MPQTAAALIFQDQKKGLAMPTQSIIVIAGIISVFAVFAVTMAWVDYYTRDVRVPGARYFGAHEPAE
jgi:hypothetical protein